MNEIKQKIQAINIDYIGMFLSLVCGIHCVVFPLLLVAEPMLSQHFLFSHALEEAVIAISLLLASSSFIWGYIKHNNIKPLLVMVLSAAIIFIAHTQLHEYEIMLMPLAGLVLATAHFYNHRLLHASV